MRSSVVITGFRILFFIISCISQPLFNTLNSSTVYSESSSWKTSLPKAILSYILSVSLRSSSLSSLVILCTLLIGFQTLGVDALEVDTRHYLVRKLKQFVELFVVLDEVQPVFLSLTNEIDGCLFGNHRPLNPNNQSKKLYNIITTTMQTEKKPEQPTVEKKPQEPTEPKGEDEEAPANQAEAKLSKNQLKKLRQKRKKEREAAAAAQQQEAQKVGEAVPVQPVVQAPKKAGKKGEKKPTAAALLALKALEKQREEQEELDRQKKIFEEQKRKEEEEERERERLAKLAKEKKKEEKRLKKLEDKKKGLYISDKNKAKVEKLKNAREQFEKMKHNEDDSDSDSDEEKPEGQKEATEPKIAVTTEQSAQSQAAKDESKPEEKAQEHKEQKQPPKKKFVKKKEKTLEQIYAEALKKKEQKERLAAEASAAGTKENDDWQEIAGGEKEKKEEPQQVPKPVEEKEAPKPDAAKDAHKEAKEKRKKDKDKMVIAPPSQTKKQQPVSKILKDDKLQFIVDKAGEFRSPICCILGHVDTGKTTLLDKIRNTNVQQNQAGGITQQIGATFFPKDKLVEEVNKCSSFYPVEVDVPGLLIIDTPGHESFSNLRSRGSSLCDIAILVIDLMHGLEQQTLESIELLKSRNTPFVVALNKIDRSYDWKVEKDSSSYLALKRQEETTISDYKNRLSKVITELNQKGFNACMYWQNEDPSEYVSLIPTSGVTGEGLPDLLSVLVKYSLTMQSIRKRIRVSKKKFNCTVMEVKMIEGHGTTIDCILVDGKLRKDDQIVLLGFRGPIITKIKALLTPHPMKEMRVKNEFLYHDEMAAANGVKISAHGLDEAVAGTPLLVAHSEEEVEDAVAICEAEYENVKKKIILSPMGVGVAASTLGSLEALLDYLNKEKIPVSYVSVGPVSKDDVLKAMKSLLMQNPERRKKQYCCLLVFDVKVLADAQKYAQQNNIRIFSADIIYHLTDHFNKFVKEIKEQRKQKEGKDAVFPCILKQVAAFRKNDPIVLGVDVEEGVLKIGTPICVYSKDAKEKARIGVVESIESNHKKIKEARKATGSVAIQLGGDPRITVGKDFDAKDRLVSIISRKSIDLLKEHFRDQVNKDEWALVIELKKYFNIQ